MNPKGTGSSAGRGLAEAKRERDDISDGDESGLDDDDDDMDEEADADADEEDDDEMEDDDDGAKASMEDDDEDELRPGRGVGPNRRAGNTVAASSPASSLRSHSSRRKGKGSRGIGEKRMLGGEETPSELGDDDEDLVEDDADDDEEEEESSDMDVQECEKKRTECMDELAELEKQFTIMREQLYRERMSQIEEKLGEVRSGKAPEYLQPLEELQINMKTRLEVGTVLRDLRLANIQCKREAERLAAEQNYKSEKELLWDSLKDELEEKIHLLEEDKNNIDLTMWDTAKSKTRRTISDASEGAMRKRPVTVSGPFIVYMLRPEDILDDWTAIRKSLAQRKKIDVK